MSSARRRYGAGRRTTATRRNWEPSGPSISRAEQHELQHILDYAQGRLSALGYLLHPRLGRIATTCPSRFNGMSSALSRGQVWRKTIGSLNTVATLRPRRLWGGLFRGREARSER
jgi:hypothetical protein